MKKLACLAVLLSSCMPWQNWHLAGNPIIYCSVSASGITHPTATDAWEKYPQHIYLYEGTKVAVYQHFSNGKTAVEIMDGPYAGTLAYCPTDKIKR